MKTSIFISINSRKKGGGSNSFASNLGSWIKRNKSEYKLEKNILKADLAIVIAHHAELKDVINAREKGCFIIHRLDEYFVENESGARKEKHDKIRQINRHTDVTVYQSEFVFNNVHPYLNPEKYEIIHNGADIRMFFPAKDVGEFIGHVSWSQDKRKGYDFVYNFIKQHSEKKFLLVGGHRETGLSFDSFSNVKVMGKVKRDKLASLYREMSFLLYPSLDDPCPNVAVESILSGVPVCFDQTGGTKEIVQSCGTPLSEINTIMKNPAQFRMNCFDRADLNFENVARKYMSLK